MPANEGIDAAPRRRFPITLLHSVQWLLLVHWRCDAKGLQEHRDQCLLRFFVECVVAAERSGLVQASLQGAVNSSLVHLEQPRKVSR
jgi:hypothetical protein